MTPFVFPRWANRLCVVVGVGLAGAPVYFGLLVAFGASPETTDVGYMPRQPVPYDHQLHVSELGVDCRYCHVSVEQGANASIPPTAVCMNCHKALRMTSPLLLGIRESYFTGRVVRWVKVHDMPDYVYFNHGAHAQRGVGCISCHGRVDQMVEVWQEKSLSMGFCLECHRRPELHLRPVEEITNANYRISGDVYTLGRQLRDKMGISPSTDCSTCHR